LSRVRAAGDLVRAFLRIGARPVASVRDVFRRDLRRSQRRLWARRGRLTAAAAVYAGAALVAGLVVDWWVAALMLTPFALEALRIAWRARPSWGRAAGLPPGRVGVGTEPMLRFDALAEAARRYGPVFKSNYYRDPLVCIADLPLGTELLRRDAEALGHRPNFFNANIPGGAIRWAAEPRHSDLRRLFGRAMSARAVGDWVPVFDGILRAALDEVASPPQEIVPRDLLREAARRVCTAFLYGVLPVDPEYGELREHMGFVEICRPYPVTRSEAEHHLERLEALVLARLADTTPGRPRSVSATLACEHPDALDDPGVLRNLIYLGLGPRDDLAGLLTWVCWYLAQDPGLLTRVRSTPDGDDLAGRIVSETLRLDQSEYIARFTERDLQVGEYRVPAGWMVRVCIREIHRDAAHFDDPTRFDPDRFLGGGPPRDVYAPLGIDHHSCIGESLARVVAGRFVRALSRYDVEVVDDGPRALSENGHWAPSERFRARLRELVR
jgi:cytochrome P450